ncbi:S-adenosyl-L-methionine-dependent methyltransferase [Catenaria anguillulae PL171]|uniref:type I protein arginine methyltransferase n=1 Tax=Catenaria anguillulae PL171 TaxID=765915 RepID=A0A1Y2HPJ3_9FUNG|nr:S-adenosyl-L-methionine-dependent methyltransferase [Catenaria anguillulae PL171]
MQSSLPRNPALLFAMNPSRKEQSNDQPAHDPGVEGRDPMYFGYYALLTHQQNMLQDTIRTQAYHQAICSPANSRSIFSTASHVFAVEASAMARRIRQLVDASPAHNPALFGKVTVVQGKVEDVPESAVPKVDVLISEPIGVLLFHERMLESFVVARDRFLKPGGTIFPSAGSIYLAPFTDAFLFTDTLSKARWWESTDFFGVDLSPLFHQACIEYFSLPVVGHFNPNSLMCTPTAPSLHMDFHTLTIDQLHDLVMPFEWTVGYTGLIHGIGGWFDLTFAPSAMHAAAAMGDVDTVVMTTAPQAATTHWQQIRFLFMEPLAVNAGDRVKGWIRGKVNAMRSYTMMGEMVLQALTDAYSEDVTKMLEGPTDECGEWIVTGRLRGRRRGRWMLNEQTYSYTYTHNPGNAAPFVPEHSCLYVPPGST